MYSREKYDFLAEQYRLCNFYAHFKMSLNIFTINGRSVVISPRPVVSSVQKLDM